MDTIFTIGHSTHDYDTFASILKANEIDAIADVRSTPFSRYSPQYSRAPLQNSLRRSNVSYVFLGTELGARPTDPSCYEAGHVSYFKLSNSVAFQEGIRRLEAGAKRYRIALLCAEKEPLDCHRAILVAEALYARGHPIRHIAPDSSLEPHTEAIERLMNYYDLAEDDLVMTFSERRHEAVRRRSLELAYPISTHEVEGAEE